MGLEGERAGKPLLRVVDPGKARALERVGESLGVNVHAEVAVPARDRARLERLCRYVCRPPIAQERLVEVAGGKLRYVRGGHDSRGHRQAPRQAWPRSEASAAAVRSPRSAPGTCDPSVAAMLDAPAFSTSVRLCGLDAPETAGCDDGAFCAPPRAAGAKVCVAQDGDVTCPAGFGDTSVTYTGAVDERTCPEPSGCISTIDASCSGNIKTHSSTDCTGPSHTYSPPVLG